MSDAKLPPTLPQWMVDHVALYQKSGGKEGHMYKVPSAPDPVPALLLTTKGRKSGDSGCSRCSTAPPATAIS